MGEARQFGWGAAGGPARWWLASGDRGAETVAGICQGAVPAVVAGFQRGGGVADVVEGAAGSGCGMTVVGVREAKARLSQLVAPVESGPVAEAVIARSGRQAAALVPVAARPAGVRIGVAWGKFVAPVDCDADAAEVAGLFGSGDG